MKKLILILLVSTLLLAGFGCAPSPSAPALTAAPIEPVEISDAPVDQADPTAAPEEAVFIRQLDPSGEMHMDLNGDGVEEAITVVVDEDAYTTLVTFRDGENTLTDKIDAALMFLRCYDADADSSDGKRELYLTGDTASDDYSTYAYRIQDGKVLRAEIFSAITDCDGTKITVETVADVMGTYGATCDYILGSDFSLIQSSPCRIIRYDGDWPERCIVLKKDGFPVQDVTIEGAAKDTKLDAGTELMLIETDEDSYALLESKEGSRYRAAISRETDDWRWFIAGTPETEWFVELRYAG